jgi:hypothetical protein
MADITKEYMCIKFCVKHGKMIMKTYNMLESAFVEETLSHTRTYE